MHQIEQDLGPWRPAARAGLEWLQESAGRGGAETAEKAAENGGKDRSDAGAGKTWAPRGLWFVQNLPPVY